MVKICNTLKICTVLFRSVITTDAGDCVPFGSYLLNSTANPAQFEWKWAGLAMHKCPYIFDTYYFCYRWCVLDLFLIHFIFICVKAASIHFLLIRTLALASLLLELHNRVPSRIKFQAGHFKLKCNPYL